MPVSRPQWFPGSPAHPAAIAAGLADRATVRIALDPIPGAAPMGLLTGRLGTLALRGRCRLAAGEQDVAVRITGDPRGGFRHHAGDAEWSILPDGAMVPLALEPRTPLEIFELLGEPPDFYSGSGQTGVWVEALRFLVDQVRLAGVSLRAEAVRRIARFCHEDHGLTYDTQDGGGYFLSGASSGIFKLTEYLAGGPRYPVSCYDQAAAVQALAGALGIEAEYCRLQPFGHLQVVELVGVGRCNNPFFEDPRHPPEPIVAGTPRSFFSNHTFCRLDHQIYDACAGPHLGDDRADTYLASVIDATVLHALRGLPENIRVAGGIVRCR